MRKFVLWVLLTFALVNAGCSQNYSSRQEFHLYILAGQSNMAGRGKVEEPDMAPHPRVFVLNQNGQWQPATDPKAMADYKKNVRIGLIPCAAGGSPVSSWTVGGYHDQTRSHPYDDAIRRAKVARHDGVLKGIVWHQGESDSKPAAAEVYQEKLEELIARFRRDLGDDKLPFIVGKLGDFYVAKNPDAELVNAVLEKIPVAVENTACVDASALTHKGDVVHFDTRSCRELGRRYADLMIKLERGERQ